MLSEMKKQMCRKGFLKAVEMALNLQGDLFAIILHILVYSSLGAQNLPSNLPKLYEHFTKGGIHSGLNATSNGFTLNGKPLQIISGAIHYFRVHPHYWRDRLRKLRAAGFNAVETYAAWNLHEPQRDLYDFGQLTNDFSPFLNIKRFLEIAKEEDLLVIFRPGPFICAEWEFGGLPSWLLQDPQMKPRQYYKPYLDRVEKYFTQLLGSLKNLQFAKGGPIVALQIENEYGFFRPQSKEYLEFSVDLVQKLGFDHTLLFTSDYVGKGVNGTLPDRLLYTVNFGDNPELNFEKLKRIQPEKPLMAMEYYPGAIEHWFEYHHTGDTKKFGDIMDEILGPKYNGSVNVYMFHGGTNFGFMAGANSGGPDPPNYMPDVTSYDYDALLSEAGDYGPKYYEVMKIIDERETPKLARPQMPNVSCKGSYGELRPVEYIGYNEILQQLPSDAIFKLVRPTSMEDLPMNNGSGQSYGYLIHRKRLNVQNGSVYSAGVIKDFGIVLVNDVIETESFPNCSNEPMCYWINSERNVTLNVIQDGPVDVDLFVENLGRVNFGVEEDLRQKKGMPHGHIAIDGKELPDFEIFALEFKSEWVKGLRNFQNLNGTFAQAPLIARVKFNVTDEPCDTFVDMSGWHKGIVLINGFNLGRYWKVGPQRTLYLPAPLLHLGENTLTIFEELEAGNRIQLRDAPDLGPTKVVSVSEFLPQTR